MPPSAQRASLRLLPLLAALSAMAIGVHAQDKEPRSKAARAKQPASRDTRETSDTNIAVDVEAVSQTFREAERQLLNRKGQPNPADAETARQGLESLALRKLHAGSPPQRAWQGGPIPLGPLDSRRQQIAVRGALAVAPATGRILVIDADVGQPVREIDVPGSRRTVPLGVLLDGDSVVFATEDGYLAKLRLDGTYAWITSGVDAVVPPLLSDIDQDGTQDVVVVGASTVSTWNGANGGKLRQTAWNLCVRPQVNLAPEVSGTNLLSVTCDTEARLLRPTRAEIAITKLLDISDNAARELIVLEEPGFERLVFYGSRLEGGVIAPAVFDSAPIEWANVSTLSVDDIDGDSYWDLLVVQDGALDAYKTNASGPLYRGMPLVGSGPIQRFDTYSMPGPGDNADRFRPAPNTLIAGFEKLRPPSVRELFPTSWQDAQGSMSLEQLPLLQDLQSNDHGTFAHDSRQLFVQRPHERSYAALQLPAAGQAPYAAEILGLAAGSAQVVLVNPERLIVCNALGQDCAGKPLSPRQRARSIASTTGAGMFWLGRADGSLVSFDASTGELGREIATEQIGSVDFLTRVGDAIVASGPKGTLTYAMSGRDSLSELKYSRSPVQQVVQCAKRGSYYALNAGELLDTPQLSAAFEKVQDQPGAIRSLACDSTGALILLSSDRGPFALRGPMNSAWPPALLALGCCLGVLLFVVGLSYRRPKRVGQASDLSEGVRLGIRTDLPLTSLPQSSDSKLRGLVHALVRFIDNEDTQPPITIGVYGPWGSGKSSAMRLVQRELEARRRYISVWFNPWRFHREKDIAAALLQSVVQEVRERAGIGRVNIALQRLLKVPALLKLAWFVPLMLISLHMLCYPHMWPAYVTLIGRQLFSIEAAGGSLLTISGVAGLIRFAQTARKVFKLNPADLLGETNQEARVDFIRHFSDELAAVLDALPRTQQVVIFVDDLDRCPPDQTLAMLEALQLLTESQRCYFVLGMDQTMVRSAIELRYRDLLELKQKQGENVAGFGAHYLEKIITLAVHVPRVSADDVELAPTSAVVGSAETSTSVRAASPGRLGPGQAFLLGWLMLSTMAFVFLFSVSRPALPLPTATPGAQTSVSAATAASSQPPSAASAAEPVQTSSTTEQVETPLEKSEASSPGSARELRRARPPEATPHLAALANKPADHDYRDSRSALMWIGLLSLVLCIAMLALAAVLYYRLRALRPVGPPVHDSPEFNAALRLYLAHLPSNPRKLIRSGNVARFLYYLVAEGLAPHSPNAFFACLLAEQSLRSIVGDNVPASELAAQLFASEAPATQGRYPPAIDERLAPILQQWTKDGAAPFKVDRPYDVELFEKVRSWLRGSTTP